MTKSPKNVSASVRARLLNHSRKVGDEFNSVLTRFAIERLLYRLSQSDAATDFILKGATLFSIWTEHRHRATHDVDLLAIKAPEPETVAELFRRLCHLEVEDDGVIFDPSSIAVAPIRRDLEDGGLRVTIRGLLDRARLSVQIDIGFGDTITPPPRVEEYPTILDQPAPKLAAYQRETVVAEKLHTAIVQRHGQ